MMLCVEDGSYVEYVGVEDFQDLEQQQMLVEDQSLPHSRWSYYNMHFNYTVIYYCFALNWWVLPLRFD
jgi:hypothetical protein